MTSDPHHPYHDIQGRQEILEKLRTGLGYPIRPDIYAIHFIQNADACYLEVVEEDEDEPLPLQNKAVPTWKTSLVPLTQFITKDETLTFRIAEGFERKI